MLTEACFVEQPERNISDLNVTLSNGYGVRLQGEHRDNVSEDNPLLARERALSQQISIGLDSYRKRRDEATEAVFNRLYG